MPWSKLASLMTPLVPLNPVGPLAVRVQSVMTAVPPLSLVTTFTRVSFGASSSLVRVQVMSSPRPTSTVSPSTWPPSQTQSLAV